jgi:hypothetical protein
LFDKNEASGASLYKIVTLRALKNKEKIMNFTGNQNSYMPFSSAIKIKQKITNFQRLKKYDYLENENHGNFTC